MNQKPSGVVPPQADPDQDNRLAPTTGMMSSGLIVLANLLKRGVLLRYKRLADFLPWTGAALGRRAPISVIRLAEAVGMDKRQVSRALAGLVSRAVKRLELT